MAKNLGPVVIVTAFTLSSLSTVLLALRLYCRRFVTGRTTIDDGLATIALLNLWGLVVTNYFQVKYGTGKHSFDIANYSVIIVPTLKSWYAYQLIYISVLYFIKVSILCFCRRLSPRKDYQFAVWAVGGIVTAYTITMLFVNAFECPNDPDRAWSPLFPQGCYNLVKLYYAMAAFNIISDVVILLLPLPTLLKLQINTRKRVALLAVFSCGSVAVVASVIRLHALWKYQRAVAHMGDVPYNAAYILLWSQIEVNAALIAACAPALKPLIQSTLGGSTWNRHGYGPNGLRFGSSGGRSTNKSGKQRCLPHDQELDGHIQLGTLRGHVPSGSVGSVTAKRYVSAGDSMSDVMHIRRDCILQTTDINVEMEPLGERNSEDSLRRLEFA